MMKLNRISLKIHYFLYHDISDYILWKKNLITSEPSIYSAMSTTPNPEQLLYTAMRYESGRL